MNKTYLWLEYKQLDVPAREQLKLAYPFGFEGHVKYYLNTEGEKISALKFKISDQYHMIIMSPSLAKQIMSEDKDYDENGILKARIHLEYLKKNS